jgi:hypothetical protein
MSDALLRLSLAHFQLTVSRQLTYYTLGLFCLFYSNLSHTYWYLYLMVAEDTFNVQMCFATFEVEGMNK